MTITIGNERIPFSLVEQNITTRDNCNGEVSLYLIRKHELLVIVCSSSHKILHTLFASNFANEEAKDIIKIMELSHLDNNFRTEKALDYALENTSEHFIGLPESIEKVRSAWETRIIDKFLINGLANLPETTVEKMTRAGLYGLFDFDKHALEIFTQLSISSGDIPSNSELEIKNKLLLIKDKFGFDLGFLLP